MLKPELRKKIIDLILIAVIVFIGFFLTKKLFGVIIPIFLGFLFAEGISSNLAKLKPISERVRKILVVLILLIFFAVLSLLAILLSDQIFHILLSLSNTIRENSDDILEFFEKSLDKAKTFFENVFHQNSENGFSETLNRFISASFEKILSAIPGIVVSIIDFLPRFFISLFIFVFSSFYFAGDRDSLKSFALSLLSDSTHAKLSRIKKSFLESLKKYCKGYSILFLMTFSLLLLGLSILRVENAHLFALLIALVDILPVLGSGTVLLPWALFSLLIGKGKFALGLFVLYLVILVIRQFSEPKILGKSIGLHPILMLGIVIIGLNLFGIGGMILLPLLCACLAGAIKE